MKDKKLIVYTLFGHSAIAILTVFMLAYILETDQYLWGIAVIIIMGLLGDYIKLLQDRADVLKKVQYYGFAAYTVTGVIGLLIYYIQG